MVEGWAERTPPGFVMHVKAFGLMTRHPVKLEVLPEDLRAEMPVDERGRVDRRRASCAVKYSAVSSRRSSRWTDRQARRHPMQLPSYVVFKDRSFDYLEWAREQLGGDEMLVEFRHRSWLDDENRAETLSFLERIGASYVTVDAPKSEDRKEPHPDRSGGDVGVRPTSASTDATSGRGTSAAGRRRSASTTCTREEELAEWVPTLKELAASREQAYAFFNNNATAQDPHNPLATHLTGRDERRRAA